MAQRLLSVWQPFFLRGPGTAAAVEAAVQLEELGYHRIWFSGGFSEAVPVRFQEILDGTRRIGVAPGIVSIWHVPPGDMAAYAADTERAHPGRFVTGLGASHAPMVEQQGTGKGDALSLHSSPHGAGRNHSRTAARKRFTRESLDTAMKGIAWGRSDAFLDEHPDAYKDIDVVMRDAADLVEVRHTLRQVVNVKGD